MALVGAYGLCQLVKDDVSYLKLELQFFVFDRSQGVLIG